MTFELRGSKVLVSRTKATRHEDPAIAKFLALLEKDMEAGRSIGSLPKSVAKKMLASLNQPVDLNTEIEGDVAL